MFAILLVSLIGAFVMLLLARMIGKGSGLLVALLPASLFVAVVAKAPIVERGWVLGEGRSWALRSASTSRLGWMASHFCSA